MPPDRDVVSARRRRCKAYAVAIIMLGVLTGVAFSDDGSPVLAPSAAGPIGAAFERLQPSLRYDTISIDGGHVVAHVCPAPDTPAGCFAVRLGPPRAGCAKVFGPFCVTFPDRPPGASAELAIEGALQGIDSTIWSYAAQQGRPPDQVTPAATPSPPAQTPAALAPVRPWLATMATAAALIIVPVGLGAILGLALRRRRRRRFTGFPAALALVAVPIIVVTTLLLKFPVVGLWDALLEGAFVGAGTALTAHVAFARRIQIWLALGSLCVSLLVLEAACRLLLPPAPGFPTAGGPHLLLAAAMRAGAESHSLDLRTKDIVCSVLYEEQYPRILDPGVDSEIVLPRHFAPRADATRRVLHIGDSMSFGFGLPRDETFTADLERLEPDTQHINGGIPGTAPDAYLAVLRRWMALQRIDLAVMYVFEGNDLIGLDDRYPCCHWQSLFTYGPEGPAMRCPEATAVDLGQAGATWLRHNSPPPYLVRALIGSSAAAAHIGAAIVNDMAAQPLAANESEETQFLHLEAILRAARDELAAQHIPFVVVVLPWRRWIENPAQGHHLAPQIMDVARRLHIPALDASDVVRDAVSQGGRIFFDNPSDPHFNAAGHEIIARWLHDHLPATAHLPPPA